MKPSKLKGKALDIVASQYGLKRKHYWWIFWEWDKSLRFRITKMLLGV
jgi:hypothetical protein